MAELDAAYFLLYGIERNDVEYILTTFAGLRDEAPPCGHEALAGDESPGLLAGPTTTSQILDHYDRLLSASKER